MIKIESRFCRGVDAQLASGTIRPLSAIAMPLVFPGSSIANSASRCAGGVVNFLFVWLMMISIPEFCVIHYFRNGHSST